MGIDDFFIRELEQLKREYFYVLYEVKLRISNSTLIIDYIVFSKSGIFCIFKDFTQGEIIGDENDEYLAVRNNGKVNYIKNPIKEKIKVVEVLESILVSNHIKITPIIAFCSKCTLSVSLDNRKMCYYFNVINLLKSQNEDYLNIYNIYEYVGRITIYDHSFKNEAWFSFFDKGKIGEYKVANSLLSLNRSEYYIFNNMLIRNGVGATSQIDHVVVSKYGIFVIETKNYNGWIFGSENKKYWTQIIYKKKAQFQNPLHQNYGHLKALKNLLKFNDSLKYVPLVVFTDECEFKTQLDSNKVVKRSYLVDAILKHRESAISNIDFFKCLGALRLMNHTLKSAELEHIRVIKERKNR